MWHFVSDQISQQLNQEFICDDIREITEGDSHSAYRISDGHKRFFVKLNDEDKILNFSAEAEGLEHIAKANIFKTPKVICYGVSENKSYLVLEYLRLAQGNEQSWYSFGSKLACMHQTQTQNMFGWQEDNFIGLTPQPNPWTKKWPQFFAEQRIGYLLQLLAEQGHALAAIDEVVVSVEKLLHGHNPAASMLHGDLWIGNTGFQHDLPVIFDPAFYYGDRETDIAMTELFNKFPGAFYDGYNTVWPLSNEYTYRKPVYQLYHILNHALLFGGTYLQTAKSLLKNMQG
ncbi:fructosamine kinase family protein [Aliiglaciecola sp. 3_MG-2023]|uniref:fructosamine kinase family protein n=1 Tax=Aliiglaciecola sp. 3_MG-2023 TaxID=3062644 RepID=UPI0026E126F4|nr:fructosamine kinase family protein [Aliiglaciecola sp. 3_MG-2023]MDO6693349.1 fructosamine kinase family protein [Aliiglaciecola sp. 3_MG-2023]